MRVNGPGEPHRKVRANRLAWELTQGPIPSGASVCHTCDNPACVRPSHLFLGTHSDNMRDASAKGRLRNYQGGVPGEQNGNAAVSEADVREIRRLRHDGVSGREVARRYGLSPAQVSRIHTGRRWAHVAREEAA